MRNVEAKLQKEIMRFLTGKQMSATTQDVAKEIKVRWHTAQVRLLKLGIEGKVGFRRVGRQNEWITK